MLENGEYKGAAACRAVARCDRAARSCFCVNRRYEKLLREAQNCF